MSLVCTAYFCTLTSICTNSVTLCLQFDLRWSMQSWLDYKVLGTVWSQHCDFGVTAFGLRPRRRRLLRQALPMWWTRTRLRRRQGVRDHPELCSGQRRSGLQVPQRRLGREPLQVAHSETSGIRTRRSHRLPPEARKCFGAHQPPQA